MPTLLLVRHGRSSANTSGVLAGRTPGVELDDTGREQVAALARMLGGAAFALARMAPRRYERLADAGAATGVIDPLLVRAYLRAGAALPARTSARTFAPRCSKCFAIRPPRSPVAPASTIVGF